MADVVSTEMPDEATSNEMPDEATSNEMPDESPGNEMPGPSTSTQSSDVERSARFKHLLEDILNEEFKSGVNNVKAQAILLGKVYFALKGWEFCYFFDAEIVDGKHYEDSLNLRSLATPAVSLKKGNRKVEMFLKEEEEILFASFDMEVPLAQRSCNVCHFSTEAVVIKDEEVVLSDDVFREIESSYVDQVKPLEPKEMVAQRPDSSRSSGSGYNYLKGLLYDSKYSWRIM